MIPADLWQQTPMLAVPSKQVAPTPTSTVMALQATGRYTWEPKWDGIRCMAYVEDGAVQLRNRRGVVISKRYPEIVASLAQHYPTGSRVFDGELLVFVGGRPEFADAHKRDAQSDPRRITALAASSPATFMAFDLLYLNGDDLRRDLLVTRQSLLDTEGQHFDNARLMVTPAGTDGPALWKTVKANRMEGVMAKLITSHYTGKRDSAWVKVKTTQRLTAVVTSFDRGKGSRIGQIGALNLALFNGTSLVSIGRVGTGFKDSDHTLLLNHLRGTTPLLVEVEFLEVSRAGQLRFPAYRGIRLDLTLADCSVDQLSGVNDRIT